MSRPTASLVLAAALGLASVARAAEPAAGGAPAGAVSRFAVLPAGAGLQRLEAPAAFLSASAAGDLADLRLVDATGREVPWLLVPPPDPAPRFVRAASVRPIPRTKVESGDEADLGELRDVAGVRLGWGGACLLFQKRVRVEGSADGRRWTTLADGETVYALAAEGRDGCAPAERLVRDTLRFAPARVRWLRVVLDDRRTPRLPPLRSAAALLADGAAPAGPRVPLRVEPRAGEPGTSRYALTLPGPHLPVRAIVVGTATGRVWRPARVLEQRLAGARLEPVELGAGVLVRSERDGVVAADLAIPVGAPEELELELAVDDGDNAPLAALTAAAELAPAPAIVFESADGAPLEARLGDPALRAPRYDLEALRPALGGMRAAAAHVGAPLGPVASVGAAATAAPPDGVAAGAAVDRRVFQLSRTVAAAPPGLAAVALDAAVLARSPTLADVRLVGPDGRQVPYLVERRDAPLAVPLGPPAPAGGVEALARSGTRLVALPLPEPSLPAGRLVVETSARVFRRDVRVYADPPDHGPRRPVLLASATWAHADPARPAPPLALDLPALEGERLVLAVDDGDNAPLPLAAARLLVPAYRLRFFHPGPELALVHGAPDLAPPRYDLALLAPRLRAAPAREVALGPAPARLAGRAPGAAGRTAFWVVLGIAVSGLLALVGRLVVKSGPPAAPSP
ncbi:DUF3999 family protein [Anaeromyxobacter oryzae]|uniref:DUF3999 domain-containing protein n=1 Tax=Anaeromyxobacter oryzae TaxID=2918170 RepID=A0ABM7X0T2_9BACT|nr:DUF3999 family protein [Anaeromyxobacter oryzae]BDG05336.1 hypothetical protein AMOR_43320 [Anaeromyxobacter oryzae]